MKPPSAAELLTLWERSQNISLLNKTLYLLELAYPEFGPEEIAKLSIGHRDMKLLLLYEQMFGTHLLNTIDCPECRKSMEWEMETTDLKVLDEKSEILKEHFIEVDNLDIRFRLPNSRDISEILANSNSQADPDALLKKCIVEIKQKNRKHRIQNLPEKVKHALSKKMEELDPGADIRMIIACPNCSFQWEAGFDIMSYLWVEIGNWAQQMLRDVYTLASAFSWSERDILNMDAGRRQYYVEMLLA